MAATSKASATPRSEPLRKPRKRRSTATVRELILTAARQLFAARGYGGATTRDVAEEAGVTEATIYRQFGSKAKLFEAAIAEPFERVIREFMEAWSTEPVTPTSNEELVRGFVTAVYDFLVEHRDLMLAFTSYRLYEPAAFENGRSESVLSRELKPVEGWIRRDGPPRGFHDLDAPLTLRCTFGVVMALVLHDDLLFPPGPRHPSRERIIREVTTFTLRGVEARRAALG